MIPKDHPRYKSLMVRHALEDGVKAGIVTPTGLIAHGRGEAFDYLIGERTHDFAEKACEAAAAHLLLARQSILSINGNSAILVPDEMISLAKAVPCELEINLFHDASGRREKIANHFAERGASVLGVKPDAKLAGLTSDRANVDSRGMLTADVVVVSLEDGDRTEMLVKSGKVVIAIDLNPLSRTPQMATVSIIDNVTRAFPLIEKKVDTLRARSESELRALLAAYDNKAILEASIRAIRSAT